MLRSAEANSLIVKNKLAGNVLPTTREVLEHYYYIRQVLMDTDPNFLTSVPSFSDVQDLVQAEVKALWEKASLPIVNSKSVQNKLKRVFERFAAARKRAKKLKSLSVDEEWLDSLFDISTCRCDISETCQTYKDRCLCSCKFESRIPATEIKFLLDQRSTRQMILTSSKDLSFNKRKKKAAMKLKRRNNEENDSVPSTSKTRRVVEGQSTFVLSSKLRPRTSIDENVSEALQNTPTAAGEESKLFDPDYQHPTKYVKGGKAYKKVRSFVIGTDDCVKADRRLTSIRQQSDLQQSTVGKQNIAASPATVHRKREQCRLTALRRCEDELTRAKAIQMCYDGKIITRKDRYAFLGQFLENGEKMEKVIAIKTFEEGASVTSEAIFSTATEQCGHVLGKVYSVMSDTTALNTGKKTGVNKRLVDFCKQTYGHEVHTLECLFHVNEIYLTHVISKVEGKKKGPGAMQEGALMKYFSEIRKPDLARAVARTELNIPVSKMAVLHLQSKMEWFSSRKETGSKDQTFRNDHMCLLALSSYCVTDVPKNMTNLLVYKQEPTCHARWITTASAYLRLLIFDVCQLDECQRSKLVRLASFIISVYAPSFFLIHLKPSVAEGPGITLFQRNLLHAYKEVDPELAEVALKYFYEHAVQWLSPINVALSVFAEVPPYSFEAVTTGTFPQSVDTGMLVRDRKTTLKCFFTSQSKNAPCIMCSEIPAAFWRCVENNNRATERIIGKMKGVVQSKIVDSLSGLSKSDVRIRAYLSNVA